MRITDLLNDCLYEILKCIDLGTRVSLIVSCKYTSDLCDRSGVRCNPEDASCLLFAADGHGALLEWAYEHGATLTQKCANKAANRGDRDLLGFILDKGPKRTNAPANAGYKASRFFNKNLYVMAVLGGRRKLIDWLFQEKCKHSWRVSEAAAYRGDLEVLTSLDRNGVEIDFHASIAASRNGHVHVLRFLRNLKLLDSFNQLLTCTTAAVTTTQLETLVWLDSIVTDKQKFIFYSHIWRIALYRGKDSVIFWVAEKKEPHHSVIDDLAGRISMDVAKYLLEEKAYRFGDLSIFSIVKLGRTDLYDYINGEGRFVTNILPLGNLSSFYIVEWIDYISDHEVPFEFTENIAELMLLCCFERKKEKIDTSSRLKESEEARLVFGRNLEKVLQKWRISPETQNLLENVLQERVWEIEVKDDVQAFEWALFYERPRVLKQILERTPEGLLGEFFKTSTDLVDRDGAMDLVRKLIKDDAPNTPREPPLTPPFKNEDAISFFLVDTDDKRDVSTFIMGRLFQLEIHRSTSNYKTSNEIESRFKRLIFIYYNLLTYYKDKNTRINMKGVITAFGEDNKYLFRVHNSEHKISSGHLTI